MISRRAKRPRPARAALRGTPRRGSYRDAVRTRGQHLAAHAIKPDIAALLAEIRVASSLEDARARVLRRYRALATPHALAEILRKTTLLAHLSGQGDAVKEI